MTDWTRIPIEISNETDRRTLCAILASVGLEVRIVKVKLTKGGTPKKYIEYRQQAYRQALPSQEGRFFTSPHSSCHTCCRCP